MEIFSARMRTLVSILLFTVVLAACTPALSSTPSPNTVTPATSAPPSLVPTSTPALITGVQAVNGTQLYYEKIGTGAPLFVLHGGPGGSHTYFLPYLQPLSDSYQLVFCDQRGTGLSDGNIDVADITIDQFVEDLESLRVAFGLQKISLMGHSWGAIIALAYALKYQRHLDHLILVAPVPVNATYAVALNKTMQQRVQNLSAADQKTWIATCNQPESGMSQTERKACNRIDAQLRFYDPAKAVSVNWATEDNTLKNSATVGALLASSFSRIRLTIGTQLSTLQVPTLIVHGDFDPIPVESSEYLHQHIAGSQMVEIAESGHFIFIEQPEEFIKTVQSFLAR